MGFRKPKNPLCPIGMSICNAKNLLLKQTRCAREIALLRKMSVYARSYSPVVL